MAFSGLGCITSIDMQLVFPAMVEDQHARFGSDSSKPTDGKPLLPAYPVAVAASSSWPEVDAAVAECVEDRSFRRRMANRESARRSRARKLRRLDELRDSVVLLERENRDLAARADDARARLAVALLANAALRAEAAAMSGRLAAACTPAGLPFSAVCTPECLIASTDMEQMIASWIAKPLE